MADNEILNKILEELSTLNIKAIYKTGSQVLPYIHNKKDLDFCIVIPSFKDLTKEIHHKIFELKATLGIDLICIEEATFLENKIVAPWVIEAYYFESIYGEAPKKINILEHKDEYLEMLRNWLGKEAFRPTKVYSEVLAGLYVLENNSYDLTDKQIENINILHDNQDVFKIADLIIWIYNKFGFDRTQDIYAHDWINLVF